MFPLINKYLLQFKKVSIPHIGSFHIIYQPAVLDVADKKILAPFYITKYISADNVSDHQSAYFAAFSQHHSGDKGDNLSQFGLQLKENLRKQPLHWQGLGILKSSVSGIIFNAEEIKLEALSYAEAQRVIRENAGHTVLVGDTERSSTEITNELHLAPVQRSYFNLAGWTLLGLSILFIVYLLYKGSFRPEASGLKKQTSYYHTSSCAEL